MIIDAYLDSDGNAYFKAIVHGSDSTLYTDAEPGTFTFIPRITKEILERHIAEMKEMTNLLEQYLAENEGRL